MAEIGEPVREEPLQVPDPAPEREPTPAPGITTPSPREPVPA